MPEGNCKGLRILFEYMPTEQNTNWTHYVLLVKEEIIKNFKEFGVDTDKLEFSITEKKNIFEPNSSLRVYLWPRNAFTFRQFIQYAEHL